MPASAAMQSLTVVPQLVTSPIELMVPLPDLAAVSLNNDRSAVPRVASAGASPVVRSAEEEATIVKSICVGNTHPTQLADQSIRNCLVTAPSWMGVNPMRTALGTGSSPSVLEGSILKVVSPSM